MSTSEAKPYVAARIAAQQRLAKRGTCPRCGVEVLVGPDHDRVAMMVTVNAEPIDPKWEARAWAAGRATFDAERRAEGVELHYRETWHRDATPYPIHVWHVCRGVVE